MLPSYTPLLSLEWLPLGQLVPDANNARLHTEKQIKSLAKAIQTLGFNNPILIDKHNIIIAGHARVEAAKRLKIEKLPVIRLEHLTPTQIRAYRLADNRIAELAQWDENALRIELQDLCIINLDFDITVTGFETPEIDLLLLAAQESAPEETVTPVQMDKPAICRIGEIWELGKHKIICGNSLDPKTYQRLMHQEKADMVFTDPPYNVPINGHVLTTDHCNHSEFAMATGEMSEAEFITFLQHSIAHMVSFSRDGSLHYICMDWRHIYELIHSAKRQYSVLKNICIWNKSNGGMGSLYRSKHEMVCVFKQGIAPHTNNIELGKHGRYRTNVWDYAGQNSPHAERNETLSMHPTVKPVQMIADAIFDCTHRNDIILDPFGGSGSCLLAAEKTGRKARLIEIEPRYVDVTIMRWEKITGNKARLLKNGNTFEKISASRLKGAQNE